MSRIFYDHLTMFEKIAPKVGMHMSSPIERGEIWHIIDELTHHRVVHLILEKLPLEHHEKFLQKFAKAPYDNRIVHFLEEHLGDDIQQVIASDLALFEEEILQIIQIV